MNNASTITEQMYQSFVQEENARSQLFISVSHHIKQFVATKEQIPLKNVSVQDLLLFNEGILRIMESLLLSNALTSQKLGTLMVYPIYEQGGKL